MIELTVDGTALQAPAGQSLAAVLLTAGRVALRNSPSGTPRGLFCGIGVCQECRVVVDGAVARACVTPVAAGMTVTTGRT
ncbi:2Fe-2S iron-sulfur cluster protein [Solirubrobacter pauli]|uniref:2Fe-2S iron-sulfur cluster protein n=1 Tax=Solirubrobacter pauli TaxID=166793 RepID=A0A660LBW2_9ACTN|nr:(2Fe-2S)-binding protein [Solirubrobacter pauli]RKQ92557.1 2Fe-2S iron-sulfur cluster protein [Solirubrobacter pauli]